MTEQEANNLLTSLAFSHYCASLPASDLFEALCERIEGRVNIEEMEISSILCEIAERLGQLATV